MESLLKEVGPNAETGEVWLPPVWVASLGKDVQVDLTSYEPDTGVLRYVARLTKEAAGIIDSPAVEAIDGANLEEGFVALQRLPAFFRADARYDLVAAMGFDTQPARAGRHIHLAYLNSIGHGITDWFEDHLHFVMGGKITIFSPDKHGHLWMRDLPQEEWTEVHDLLRSRGDEAFSVVVGTTTTDEDPLLDSATGVVAQARTGGDVSRPQTDQTPFVEVLTEALQRGLTKGRELIAGGAENVRISTKVTPDLLIETDYEYTPGQAPADKEA